MNRDEFVESLLKFGFTKYKTRVKTYFLALVSLNESKTIYVLLRKFGVDFIYYNHLKRIKLDDEGLLYTDATNGYRVRNTYDGTDFNIHKYIIELVKIFNDNQPFKNNWLKDNGYSTLQKRRIFLDKIAQRQENDLAVIFQDVEPDSNGYKYISDGMWLTPDGELTDEEPMF